MGYSNDLTTDSGVKVGHWMLTHRNNEYLNRKVWFVLSGFLDEQCCSSGKKPVVERPYTVSDVDPASLTDDTLIDFAMKADAAAAARLTAETATKEAVAVSV